MKVVLAFSGGLDTTFCTAFLRHEKQADVVTVTVNTGGLTDAELEVVKERSRDAGAIAHHLVDARQTLWDRFVTTLIQGNVLRGNIYPLSVAAERTQQAIEVAKICRQERADAVAHGSTGAGNDQVRFDIAFRILLPEIPILTPIRDLGLAREQAASYLAGHGIQIPPSTTQYSINSGLWGTTLGGGWTHDPWQGPPSDAWPAVTNITGQEELIIQWEKGLPTAIDGEIVPGPLLVAKLDARLAPWGIGRGIHLGETVLGIKGRIGFQAGAALVLIGAHRELEKLVLTRWQMFWKDMLGQFFGDRLHEGQAFDPVMADIAALIESSQQRVTGETRVHLTPGAFSIVGLGSPFSLLDPQVARYGESHSLWSGDEVRAFAKIAAIPSLLAARVQGDPPW